MKYIYLKKVTNQDKLPLELGNEYNIEKDNRFKDSYKITNFGLTMNSYTLKKCFKLLKQKRK